MAIELAVFLTVMGVVALMSINGTITEIVRLRYQRAQALATLKEQIKAELREELMLPPTSDLSQVRPRITFLHGNSEVPHE